MKTTFLMCAVSAFLGALLAVSLTRNAPRPGLLAQDDRSADGQADNTDILRTAQLPPRPTAPTRSPSASLARGSGISSDELSTEERINIAVYAKVNRSVVNITTRSVRPDAFFMFEVPTEGAGSGSVLDKSGHILTNQHVISDARAIQVTLYDGKAYEASLVGQDPPNDIAILKIDAPRESLYPVTLGESSSLRVGQKVLAIGNPLGLERTMTVGIVSSLNRALPSRTGRTMKSIIQIDAALNQGNSGGPLLDSHGNVIGMNTAIASPSGAGENIGIGFALPVNAIRRVVPLLIEHGRVIRADIGITRVAELSDGLLIASTAAGGAAERAGLRGFRVVVRGSLVRIDRSRADILLTIDSKKVNTVDDLLTVVESKRPGDEVVVTILRDGREIEVSVVLDEAE